MPIAGPLTPNSRARRIANGRARFDALKKARIARMRDAANEEEDVTALMRLSTCVDSSSEDPQSEAESSSATDSETDDTPVVRLNLNTEPRRVHPALAPVSPRHKWG